MMCSIINIDGIVYIGSKVSEDSKFSLECLINENLNIFIFKFSFETDNWRQIENFICSAPGNYKVSKSVGEYLSNLILSKLDKYIRDPLTELYIDSVHNIIAEHVLSYYKVSVISMVRKPKDDKGISHKTLQPMRKYLEIFEDIRKKNLDDRTDS